MTNLFLYEVKAAAFKTHEINGSHYLNLSVVLRNGETVDITLCGNKPIAIEGPVDDLSDWAFHVVVAEREKERGMG